jgi:hypothetical protein
MTTGRLVGRFPEPEGRLVALIHDAAGPGRPATLEEVVLGHLAAGRNRAATASAMPAMAGPATEAAA